MPPDPSPLTSDVRKRLLRIARESIIHHGFPATRFQEESANRSELFEDRAVFVTLTKSGRLRGCIGHLEPQGPLWKAVADMACSAAYGDPRFPPVEASEIPELEIEISVLTLPEPLEDPETIEIGRDGLIVEREGYRGVLLPQVAGERNWDRRTFLEQTCRKAGLDTDAWKDPETRVYRFQAYVFGEKEDLAE